MKRSRIKHRPRRNRDLTPDEWWALSLVVKTRDRQVMVRWMVEQGFPVPRPIDPVPCPAVAMDPSQLGTCSGHWQLDHVKDDLMTGQKAPDDEDHLVSHCETHDERGMRAGRQWNTSHRSEQRKYLQERRRERAARG